MKTVMLINNTAMNLYNLTDLKTIHGVRVIGVFSPRGHALLDEKTKADLHEIYVIPCKEHTTLGLTAFPFDALENIYCQVRSTYGDIYVCASDEINCLTVSKLRDKYKLGGACIKVIERYRHKLIQKETLKRAKIRIPAFFDISSHTFMKLDALYNKIKTHIGERFIIKPATLAGTVGVKRITNIDEFRAYAHTHDLSQDYIAEQYIDGSLFHVDLIFDKEHLIFGEVCAYLWSGLSFLQGKNHGSIMLSQENPLRARMLSFALQANDALGLERGCVHMEIFVTPNQDLYFLEAGPRPAGSLVPRMYEKAYKRSFLNAALLCELGIEQPPFAPPITPGFWMRFPKLPGKVIARNIPHLASTSWIEWFVEEGDILTAPESIAEKVGQVSVFNQDMKTLQSDFESFRTYEALKIA